MSVNDKIVGDLVANKVEFITTVPCKQLAGVIDKINQTPSIHHVPANKEDEGKSNNSRRKKKNKGR